MKNRLTNSKRKNAGFTLLELVVVVAVMGLISSMAMDVYTDNTNQARYDLTKKRVEEIRYAIIGDDSRSLNGQPTISGFIADTGKVPSEIRQLILKEYCEDDPWQVTDSDCTSTWVDQTEYNWKGPYLKAYSSVKYTRKIGGVDVSKNIPVYRDGWGGNINNHQVISSIPADALIQKNNQIKDMKNFGWEFVGASDISLQSYGLDRDQNSNLNPVSLDPTIAFFEEDYPASGVKLIHSNQYGSSPNPLNIKITNKSGTTKTICLMWDGIETANSSSQTILHDASYTNTIAPSTMGFINFTLDKDGDCDISDGQTINISKTRAVVHYSITDPTFTVTFN
jgi:prepilin-type N-terminal cleavage/methylation domain-containing protein